MLNFTDVTVRRGPRILFSHATFSLFRGEKAGITGENGSGKSTLLALVRHELQPDAGSFEMPGNLQVAAVSQELEATEQLAIEFVLDGDAELREVERLMQAAEASDDGERIGALHGRYGEIGGYDARARAAQLMHGLGFDTVDEARPIRAFSGGWRVRINVARALMCRSDLLLLDEPTNHLDIDAILWLENWLREYRGTLLLIAHDREFLDRVCDRIVNIEQGQISAYRGNYSAFETQRAADLAEQGAMYQRQQREIRHMESFVERFRAKASKARQAQSRIKALERMQRIAPAHVASASFEFDFGTPLKLPNPLLVLEDQSVGYGQQTLLSRCNLTVLPGDRIALLGRNGAGKSTFMKLLAGVLPSDGGTRVEARDLAIGYFAQHHLEQLKPQESPLQHLQHRSPQTEMQLREYLARFGFRGDRVFEPIGPFSGGEKARLVLALVSHQRPNLLLLDEPTNHLDLEMRQALAVTLQDYAGAVVLVSHDRHLLNSVADQLLLVDGGSVVPFEGDLEDYARWATRGTAATTSPTPPLPAPPTDHRQRKGDDARRRELVPLRKAVADREARFEQLVGELAEVEQALAAPELYQAEQRDRLAALLQDQHRLAVQIKRVESEWVEAQERLEAREAQP